MKFILDVNVLLSALIRDSSTRKIIINSGLDFYFPEISLNKIDKYKEYIIEKAEISEQEFARTLELLFQFIKIIPSYELDNHLEQAKTIMEHIDIEDVTFIAGALSKENSAIWSDDKDFEKQTKIKVLKTKDILELLEMG